MGAETAVCMRRDGSGADALLQHPLAVLALADGTVLVADSYNHRLKVRPTSGRWPASVKACSYRTQWHADHMHVCPSSAAVC